MFESALSLNLPKVAVVILNYNGRGYLEQFLPSVLGSLYPNMELYVADNGSSDDSIDFLMSWGFELFVPTADNLLPNPAPKSVRIPKYIIKLPENYGFAEGYNLALKPFNHIDYFVLLNSDVEVTPDWIDPIIKLMESDATIAAVQPKIKMFANKESFEHAGASGGFLDHWGYPFCRGRIFGELEVDNGQYEDNREIFWASGAAMFVRAKLYNAIGGLDGDYFAHMEEIDFCWRIKRAGYRVMVCPQSTVYHVGGGTLPAYNPRKEYLNFRNSLATLLKNKETFWSAFGSIFVRLLLDGVAAVQFLSKGKFKSIGAIIRAHWHFFMAIPKHWKKRKDIAKRISILALDKPQKSNMVGMLKGSIVWQHFIKRKKKFDDLGL
jgi:GT2 family glycosyltransferase